MSKKSGKDDLQQKVEALAEEADSIMYDEDNGVAYVKPNELTLAQIVGMYKVCEALADLHESSLEKMLQEAAEA